MASYEKRLFDLWGTLYNEMEDEMLNISADSIPEACEGEELSGDLYNSERDYMEQIAAYKVFQGKEPKAA